MSDSTGKLSNTVLPGDQFFVPLRSVSGTFLAGFNEWNFSTQYNYAAKHNPQVFFTDSNGGNDLTASNPLAKQYAPLQQLAADLAGGGVADYNWITPNQFNDMHTGLANGFAGLTGDNADRFDHTIPFIVISKDAHANVDGVPYANVLDYSHSSFLRTMQEIFRV
ncbi:MAG TPA: hypothetical protein VEU08_19325, partial [Vicinamibacterales bacterium]|nr:hypothetical protein [Vicinamibacterales bacterium]